MDSGHPFWNVVVVQETVPPLSPEPVTAGAPPPTPLEPSLRPQRGSGWRRAGNALLLIALVALAVLARCWNAADVFVEGRIFFVDPDCYSRMTRASEIFHHPGRVIHEHLFENWPTGISSHTTAPMDYSIAVVAWLLKPFAAHPLDLAGAVTPVLMGVATLLFLWFWAGRLRLPYRVPLALLFAVSPVLVHGTSLGRPDHQALQILTLAVALGAEVALMGATRRGEFLVPDGSVIVKRWSIVAGVAWGMSLWVSLYEPGILLLVTAPFALLWHGWGLLARERRWGYALFGAVLAVAALVDGWRSPIPTDPDIVKFFPNWSLTIAELRSVAPWSPLLLAWSLALLPAVPFLLAWGYWKGEHRNAWWLWCGGCLLALVCWQMRWGYFFGLAFVMALPWVLAAFQRRWVALLVFAVSLWPVAREWDEQLAAEGDRFAQRLERRQESLELHGLATALKQVHGGDGENGRGGTALYPVLSPWWLSPAMAYWSGQPNVAGSSHQSLPGTVDASRFYRSTFWPEAAEILARRKVYYVVAYMPERVLNVSEKIIGNRLENPENTMASILFTQPHSAPDGLELEGGYTRFRIFRVKGALPATLE